MRDQVEWTCPDHPDQADCPDSLIAYSAVFNEYGLRIHDGGTSSSAIANCPWCGFKLPMSMRDRWFSELNAQGFDDPFQQDIPKQYRTDEWYQQLR